MFKDGQCPNVDQIPALKSIDTETLNANAATLQAAVSELEDITAWRVVSMLEFGIDRRTEKTRDAAIPNTITLSNFEI